MGNDCGTQRGGAIEATQREVEKAIEAVEDDSDDILVAE